MAVLDVTDLQVAFGPARILRGISLSLEAGHTLGVVGESGCGKSMTGMAIMGMIPFPGRVTSGSIQLNGRELVGLKGRDMREVRGKEIALVMQDPFTSLNPMMRVGWQIAEALRIHRGMNRTESWKRAVELLDEVGVPAPESSAKKYPHQMSGGQRQRVVIAIAFACRPKVLIADEPTTALDVTLQAQILRLIRDLKQQEGTAVMLISHDIGVIGSLASRVSVFYAGKVVEMGASRDVLLRPTHPYTRALLSAMPNRNVQKLNVIEGHPPDLTKKLAGCAFAPRCEYRFDQCSNDPQLVSVRKDQDSACWKSEELVART